MYSCNSTFSIESPIPLRYHNIPTIGGLKEHLRYTKKRHKETSEIRLARAKHYFNDKKQLPQSLGLKPGLFPHT
jgi:hypothetical protein